MSAQHTNLREQKDGSYYFKRPPAEVARSLEAVQTTQCLCGAKFHGTAADGIRWHQEHRADNHPEWQDRGQTARRLAAKSAPMSYWTSRTEWGEQ